MKTLFHCVTVSLLMIVISCKKGDQTVSQENTSADQPAVETSRPGSNYTDDGGHTINMNVKLNNGAKWEANIETTNGIGAMLGMVNEMTDAATLEDYQTLHKKLATRFQKIFQECTMKGEAHEQLHNYLIPLKEKLDRLKDGDLQTCQKTLPDIKEYLGKYSHFFYT
jgi:hypothetical protein